MIRVVLDTNIVLDTLLKREPWFEDSARVWQACADGAIDGHIAATELTNLYYIARKLVGRDRANTMVRVVLDSFSVLAITDDVLRRASAMSGPDFEDDVISTCATLNPWTSSSLATAPTSPARRCLPSPRPSFAARSSTMPSAANCKKMHKTWRPSPTAPTSRP